MTSAPSPAPSPGAADPARRRTLRAAGLLLTVAGLVLVGIAVADLLGAFDESVTTYELDGLTAAERTRGDDGPGLVWLLVLALPALLGGALCLRLAAATARGGVAPARAACPACGAGHSADDRFCGSCGATLV